MIHSSEVLLIWHKTTKLKRLKQTIIRLKICFMKLICVRVRITLSSILEAWVPPAKSEGSLKNPDYSFPWKST